MTRASQATIDAMNQHDRYVVASPERKRWIHARRDYLGYRSLLNQSLRHAEDSNLPAYQREAAKKEAARLRPLVEERRVEMENAAERLRLSRQRGE